MSDVDANMSEESRVTRAKDPTETILSQSSLKEKYLCDYVINVASGCIHGCEFCYVPATPNIKFRGDMLKEEAGVDDGQEEWGEYALYRDDIPEEIDGLLDRKRTWNQSRGGQGIVGISYSTDCYMDRRAGEITRAVVDSLARHNRYARVQTRNPVLAAQDLDVYIQHPEYVTVGSSINSLNAEAISAIEPNAPLVDQRLRGLKRFSEAGVRTFVSMSPTYPTMTKSDLKELLCEISRVDPDVIFHEPINPRGANFELMVEATWIDYACQHFQWVQELGEELDLPIHLWPDKQLCSAVGGERERWLRGWRQRQSVEDFANRPDPAITPRPP